MKKNPVVDKESLPNQFKKKDDCWKLCFCPDSGNETNIRIKFSGILIVESVRLPATWYDTVICDATVIRMVQGAREFRQFVVRLHVFAVVTSEHHRAQRYYLIDIADEDVCKWKKCDAFHLVLTPTARTPSISMFCCGTSITSTLLISISQFYNTLYELKHSLHRCLSFSR